MAANSGLFGAGQYAKGWLRAGQAAAAIGAHAEALTLLRRAAKLEPSLSKPAFCCEVKPRAAGVL